MGRELDGLRQLLPGNATFRGSQGSQWDGLVSPNATLALFTARPTPTRLLTHCALKITVLPDTINTCTATVPSGYIPLPSLQPEIDKLRPFRLRALTATFGPHTTATNLLLAPTLAHAEVFASHGPLPEDTVASLGAISIREGDYGADVRLLITMPNTLYGTLTETWAGYLPA